MTASKQVLRWYVPVDDRDHPIGAGRVVHVACRGDDIDVVTVWTEETDETKKTVGRRARVYGTGQPVPAGDEHIGTAVTSTGRLVWHLYSRPRPRRNG